jgi:hypothetical protein
VHATRDFVWKYRVQHLAFLLLLFDAHDCGVSAVGDSDYTWNVCALYDGELLAWLDFMEGWWAIATQTSQGCIECRFLTVSLIHDPSLGLTNETGS